MSKACAGWSVRRFVVGPRRRPVSLRALVCHSPQVGNPRALEAAANVLDTDLTRDLGTMIERTEHELAALNDKIQAVAD